MSRALGVTTLVLILASLCSPASAQVPDNDYYASRGTALLNTVERYHLYPGQEKYRSKNYHGAWDDFSFLLRYFPNHPRGLVLMTELCTEWKSSLCALDVMFDKAIALRPDATGTFVANGIYLHRIKHYNQAVESYERALQLEPDSLNAHYNLALAYIDLRRYDLANEHAQRAYALGASVPGLREKLKKAGQWKPLPVDAGGPPAVQDASTPNTGDSDAKGAQATPR